MTSERALRRWLVAAPLLVVLGVALFPLRLLVTVLRGVFEAGKGAGDALIRWADE